MPDGRKISDLLLPYDCCCGCGACAGVCPQQALQMRLNDDGEYRPCLVDQCSNCGLCSRVCPSVAGNPNKDDLARARFAGAAGIQHTSATGYYLECFVGYAAVHGHRPNGASGGLATWMLATLLRLGEVDGVVCVKPRRGGHPLFEFTCCRSEEEVRACSRSSYYPVELSGVIRRILSEERRYAVIGLPCVCKALRLCAQASPRLGDRMPYILGLTCGHGVSAWFSEYLFALAGGKARDLDGIAFRVKDPHRPVRDCGMVLAGRNGQGEYERRITGSQGPWAAFKHRYFTPLACDLCGDAFAHCADAVFMDAWLPEYARDCEGNSIVLTRNERIRSVIRQQGQTECVLRPIEIARVIGSQKGALRLKCQELHVRRQIRQRVLPLRVTKRVRPRSGRMGFLRRLLVRAQWDIARQSASRWRQADRELDRFRRMTRSVQWRLVLLDRLVSLSRRPGSALRRVGRSLAGSLRR